MRPSGIHDDAIIGDPPEDRTWQVGDPFFYPEIDETACINALVTIDSGLKRPTRVGARTLIMKKCHLGHDSQVGADCELAPGVVICGYAEIGDRVRIGVNASVLPYKKVGDGARIGSGAVVTHDVPPGETWIGVPARRLVI